METADIIKVIVENGVTIGVIVFFMFRDLKFINQLNETLNALITSVETLKKVIEAKDK